jgi:hypothetical protein
MVADTNPPIRAVVTSQGIFFKIGHGASYASKTLDLLAAQRKLLML